MLSSLSWQTYWTITGTMIAAYYFFVLAVFYQKEIMGMLTRKPAQNIATAPPPSTSVMGTINEQDDEEEESGEIPETIPAENMEFYDEASPDDPYEEEASDKDAFDTLEKLSKELQRLMNDYGRKGNRTELVTLIRKKLMAVSAATDLKPFKETLDNYITEQCRTRCNIRLEPADIRAIWLKYPA